MSQTADAFDPYRKWLGIAPAEQPAHHYRLLGINLFEDDPDVIESAADRQMAHVRTFQSGRHSAESQRLLNELSAARICLLDRNKKAAYDAELRARLFRQREERQRERKAQEAAAPPFGFYVKGAWRYAVVQARRFWLGQTRLPPVYWRLGLDVYSSGRDRNRFDSLYGKLDSVDRELSKLQAGPAAATVPPPATGGMVPRVTRSLKASLLDRRRTRLLESLGRAAYDAGQAECGPVALVGPIEETVARLDDLRAEVETLSKIPPGQVLSPQRLAWIVVGIAAFLILAVASVRLLH